MARIRLTYIGGGSTRAPGTMASLVLRGARFAGSEIVLVDLDPERLEVVRELTQRMTSVGDVDVRVTTTTDRAAGLRAEAIYDEMAAAHRAWLPDRLLE